MNLMKYFNYHYMFQNLKKSKSILILFLGIMPILSVIVFLMFMSVGGFETINLESISTIHYIGIYFIPIMISMCLFGFVFKKKSVDFINSMPLSRKTIFITNTITGIILLILMVVLSGLSIYIASLFTNLILPFRMILDYILIWSVSYVFVFTLANIATSISGNGITQIIVTILLIFFVPFTIDYIHYGNDIIYGYSNNTICLINDNSINEVCYGYNYSSENITNYTLPYNYMRNNIFVGSNSYSLLNYISILKMFIISIISFIVGQILFFKRKMEINETTFSSLKIHNLVKALTMYPIVLVMGFFAINNSMNTLAAICCLLFLIIYFFVYDLITRRSISNFKDSVIHFCIIIIILFSYSTLVNDYLYSNDNSSYTYLDSSDISEYKISLDSNQLSYFNHVNITDKKSIEMITEALFEKISYSKSEDVQSIELLVKVGKKEYKFYAYFKTSTLNEIIDYIKSTDDVKDNKINGYYALGINYENINIMTDDSDILDEAIRVSKQNISCDNSVVDTYLYNYHNGVLRTYKINNCTSDIIGDYIDEIIQKENARFLSKIENLSYNQAGHKGFTYGINNYTENNHDLYTYGKEIYNFMKKYDSKNFTFDKDYISITGYLGNKKYSYHTNNVSEFIELFNREK